MAKWIRVVETNCKDPSREAEFNDWYDKVHIPDVLSSPAGLLSAKRYERKDPKPGKGKYITIYQIDTDDIERTIALHQAYAQSLREQGRIHELLELFSVSFSKEI